MDRLSEGARQRLNAELTRLMRRATDDGRLIEAGWLALRLAAVPPDAPQLQVDEMRNAFFAGAQHLFASIMGVLDEGSEPTAADLRRMDLISSELEAFITLYSLKHGLPAEPRHGGRA